MPPTKLKVLRVVTSQECVQWHLDNTLKRMILDFEICVAGDGVSAYSTIYPQIKWVDVALVRKINPFLDLKALIQLCALICKYQPHIVHSIMPKAGCLAAIAGWICRAPVRIHTFTGQVWATKLGAVRYLLKKMDQLVIRLNTLCLTDSPSQSYFLGQEGLMWRGQPLPVLSQGSLSGVDLLRFRRPELKAECSSLKAKLGLPDEVFIFAYIARKSVDKGALDILDVFSSLLKDYPYVYLLFVGPDESNGEVENRLNEIPKLRERVVNVGRVDNPEVYLGISHVLCLPSYREGFGSIIIDAAAMGLPAIGSNIPGIMDAIQDEHTGYLFPTADLLALKRCMINYIEHPDVLKKMGDAARIRVEKYFSADVLYEALKALYLKQAKTLVASFE